MGRLPARQENDPPVPGQGEFATTWVPLPAPAGPVGPIGHQVASRPPMALTYLETAPGFAALETAKLSPDFDQFLAGIVPNPGSGMWYASTQSYGNRLEATALAVGTDCLVAVNGVQPMRRDGVTRDGRPQLRRAGPWTLDYVRLPFVAGTCQISNLPAGKNTIAGGVRPGIDTHCDLAAHLSNLPAVVQDHLESCIPSQTRIRRWVRALGPTATTPERFWLFTTSDDQLAYVYSARWQLHDPSGLAQDPAGSPWAVTMLTAVIGPASREQTTLDGRAEERPSRDTLVPPEGRRGLPGRGRSAR